MEGDKRLDKLESFLDKLHNKGTVFPSVSVSVSPHRNSRTAVTFNGVNFISDWGCLLPALWFGWLTLGLLALLFCFSLDGFRWELEQDVHDRGDG